MIAFMIAACLLLLLLRPDPLILARTTRGNGQRHGGSGARAVGIRAAVAAVLDRPDAMLGLTAMAVGHMVMVGVMSMTPVHILDAGHSAALTLRIVGVVLSVHIVGMYAFAPVTGWLSDRYGRRPVIVGGIALLLLACAIAATSGHETEHLALGLMILGLGWSGTMVAGSTLLSESVTAEIRASVQGLSDATMGLAGASAGALAGFAMDGGGYPMVASLAALATLPLIWMIARGAPPRLRPADYDLPPNPN